MDIDENCLRKSPESYWIQSIHSSEYPELTEDINVDIAIVGAGMAGILAAYLLRNEGRKIAIFEGDSILQGATGYTTAKITSQHNLIYSNIKKKFGYEMAKEYAEANQTAIKTIEKIIKTNNIDCDFISESAYVYTLKEDYIDKIAEEAEIAAQLGIDSSYLEKMPLNFPVKAAVCFKNQAQFHPRKFLLPLANIITSCGHRIFEHSRIIDIEMGKNYVIKTEKNRKITAEKLIIASHYPCINKTGMYFTRLYTERSYVLAIRGKEKYPGGMYITAEDPGRSLRGQISNQGELILIGGEHHKTGQGISTIEHYKALMKFAEENFTVESVPYRWSAQDCMTMDGLPYAGYFDAKTPNMYIASGFGKWGMTNSMASAMIIKDLIIKGDSPWQEVYSASRNNIVAAAKKFVIENANVAKELIAGKIEVPKNKVEIEPGEGEIIEVNGNKVGTYRDEKGVLHRVNTTCTHMGCELKWNSGEKTWDCPCHGSRFNFDGEIIEGPAVKALNEEKDVNTISKLINEDF